MPRKYRKKMELKVEEANVLPVMNIMFLLIPALLLAMEVASMAAIPVSPPQFAARPPDDKPPEPPKEKPLKLKVFIQEDGFRVSASGQQEGAAAGQETDSNRPTIPLANPSATNPVDRYDFAALESKAQEYKRQRSSETTVTFSAESSIPMAVLVSAMDAMRGTRCKLRAVVDNAGEPPTDICYFYHAILESGAS